MPATRSVLIVEDDEVILDMLKDKLADDGFIVFPAPTLEAADKVIDAKNPRVDAVILDRALPAGDGCDYCLELRRHGYNMPIIMLADMDREEDVVRGLESGAHDLSPSPSASMNCSRCFAPKCANSIATKMLHTRSDLILSIPRRNY